MNKFRFFFVMFVIGALLGGSAYGQSLSADPHDQDFGVLAPLITQHVVVTQYITGDPHEYDRVVLPGQQIKVRTAYITGDSGRGTDGYVTTTQIKVRTAYIIGDPHDDGQLVPVLPVERRVAVIPYLTGDPHYQGESDLLLALER